MLLIYQIGVHFLKLKMKVNVNWLTMENELFPCGTNVTMILAKIPGIITAQCIRFGYIEYEVSYFSDGLHY
jgi:hypothetical protein